MDVEKIQYLQGVGFIILVIFLCFVLYGYVIHLIRSEKKGIRDYEKYSKLALDDDINDEVIEPYPSKKDSDAKKEFEK